MSADHDELKNFTHNKVKRFTSEIDDLKKPMSDAVEDLKKENLSFLRELERYDSQYKKVFGDYIEVLQEHKQVIEKLNEIEKKMNGGVVGGS